MNTSLSSNHHWDGFIFKFFNFKMYNGQFFIIKIEFKQINCEESLAHNSIKYVRLQKPDSNWCKLMQTDASLMAVLLGPVELERSYEQAHTKRGLVCQAYNPFFFEDLPAVKQP